MGLSPGSGSAASKAGAIEKELRYLASVISRYPNSSKNAARLERIAKLKEELEEAREGMRE